MDVHTRNTATLHIVTGVLGTSMMLLFASVIHWLGPFRATDDDIRFDMAMTVILALLMASDVVAAIALLKGVKKARMFVIAFGVLQLFYVPIGTVVGVYTLWALLGKRPAPAHQPEGHP
jgi:hypothetical protein